MLQQVSDNVAATIGSPYEIIAMDNRQSGKGICRVYNEGVAKAQFNILCFIHEDILIDTNNWGRVLQELFTDPNLGLVGVAGSSYRPLTPTNWGGIGPDTVYKNIIQSYKFKNQEDVHYQINPKNEKLARVTCIDGVWMCTTKAVASEIKFDEETFTGFHLYDVDFSMAVAQKYNVAVTYEILIKHLSEGTYNRTWFEETLKFFYKWNKSLPFDVEELSQKQILRGERMVFNIFIDQLIQFNFPISTAYDVLWKNFRFFKLSKKLFFKLNFHIYKRYNKAKKATA